LKYYKPNAQEGKGVLEEEEESGDERWGMGEDDGEGDENEEDGNSEEDMPEVPQATPASHVAVDPSLPRTLQQQQDDNLQVLKPLPHLLLGASCWFVYRFAV